MDSDAPSPVERHEEAPQCVSGSAALRLHLCLALGLALCAAAFWFELGRAEGGNELSWAYVFEWPLLGGFGIYMWWRILHFDAPRTRRSRVRPPRPDKPDIAPEFQGMLAGWQDHLRELERTHEAADRELRESADADDDL